MSDTGLADGPALVDPVAVGPGEPGTNGHADGTHHAAPHLVEAPVLDGASGTPEPAVSLSGADASLLALVDRLSSVVERGDLGELEVSSGATTIILRAPSAIAPPPSVATAGALLDTPGAGAAVALAEPAAEAPSPAAVKPSVKAPLTGIYYGAPSPGATPYVAVGDHVSVGQIIGLIEAMKLFNEIKSDLAGRVTRICVDSGSLVKARQPLIEVEPA
ncbi:MAG TPA: biotin/lipoyl-containing protein [Candidatus Limnocylindrales bacterium]|nr:biotin/lipoyl-containing protein [Candidatus Limnocylindrales bacterium]